MIQPPLLLPMAFYVFYIWLLGLFLLMGRISAVRKKEVPPQYFKALQGFDLPEKLLNRTRHYDNQFQLPLLFFITCLVWLALNRSTPVVVGLAWAFVASRLIHSYVHLGTNNVIQRAASFVIGWVILAAMWVLLIL